MNFDLTAFDSDSTQSLKIVQSAGQEVLALLTKHGISLDQLKSHQIDKNAKRASRDGSYGLEILGYETTQTLSLTVTNWSVYAELMHDLLSLNNLTRIDASFETTKEQILKREMLISLSAEMRSKAETLANAQSQKIKSVYGITNEESFAAAYAVF